MSSRTRRARLAGFDVVVPGDWWRIPLLTSREREEAVTALLRHQFPDADTVTALRHETQQALLGSAREAAAQGSSVWWVSTQQVQGFPIPVSALATPLEPPRIRDLGHVADGLEGLEGVVQARLRPGPVIRHTYRTAPGQADHGGLAAGELAAIGRVPALAQTPVVNADYWIERPDGRVLLLAFSSPLVSVETALLEMFDTVTDTVTWREG